jgi:hypothetical protein
VPAHCLGDAFLLGRNDFAQVLRVHTGGDCRRIDKVAEHDRDLATLGGGSDPAAGSVVTGVVPPRSLMAARIFCFFSAKRWAYSDMPSFSSQSAISALRPPSFRPIRACGPTDAVAGSEAFASALPSFSSILLGRNKPDSPTPSDGFVFGPLGRFQPAQNEPTICICSDFHPESR